MQFLRGRIMARGFRSYLAVGAVLAPLLRLLEGPSEKGHGINVRVPVSRVNTGVVKVGYRVVPIVLVLPPLHGVPLHEVPPEDAAEVTVLALLEDLMVEEVVSEPATLLPEEAHDEGGGDVDEGVGGEVHHQARAGPHGHVERTLVDVEKLGI